MAHFTVFSILVVAVALSGVYAGLIPEIPSPPSNWRLPSLPSIPTIPGLPDIIPSPNSKSDAVKRVQHGCEIGKKGVNIRISAFIADNNRDDSLNPLCKKCIAEKANQVRADTLSGIDTTGDSIIESINTASESWLSVWVTIIEDLPGLITGVLSTCKQQLQTAKSDCIAETAASSV